MMSHSCVEYAGLNRQAERNLILNGVHANEETWDNGNWKGTNQRTENQKGRNRTLDQQICDNNFSVNPNPFGLKTYRDTTALEKRLFGLAEAAEPWHIRGAQFFGS